MCSIARPPGGAGPHADLAEEEDAEEEDAEEEDIVHKGLLRWHWRIDALAEHALIRMRVGHVRGLLVPPYDTW